MNFINSTIEPSSREQLMLLRSFFTSDAEYVDFIWDQRTGNVRSKKSHKKRWPFKRVEEPVDTKVVNMKSVIKQKGN